MMEETLISSVAIFTGIVLIAVFGLALWDVFSYFWGDLYGWYQRHEAEKVMEQWEKTKKLLNREQ